MTNLEKWRKILGDYWWVEAVSLAEKIYKEYPESLPYRDLVFAAFHETDPETVNVVILGQDPYPGHKRARGVAFGYHPEHEGSPTSSMQNIINELDMAELWLYMPPYYKRDWLTLNHWTRQGVLLLNTRLSVLPGKPMSHAGLGWEELMQEALERLMAYSPVILVTWGSEAAKFGKHLRPTAHIATSHPCKYSHNRGRVPFTGSGCFEIVNHLLTQMNKPVIEWVNPFGGTNVRPNIPVAGTW